MMEMAFSTLGRKLKLCDIFKYAYLFVNLIFCILISVETAAVASYQCHDVQCVHGVCREGRCVCDQGWQGNGCHLGVGLSLNCRDIQTCDQCQKNPHCGWCDDGSGTGLGVCLEGSAAGPVVLGGSAYSLNNTVCPAGQWYFTTCPGCQCNGHSTCVNGTDKCLLPCQHLTEGTHCQQCMAGYYGDPVNGGNCTPCFCNKHGDLCHRETGRCYCTTKGIFGPHCNRCDESKNCFGNPEEENGSCFYNLSIDFQYTFNMSKPEDRHCKNINFMNIPVKPDVDVDFSISCSDSALVNISVASSSSPEKFLDENHKCGTFKLRFSHNDHVFGADNSTFYVYVFNFNTPFVLQISFSEPR